jgi:hypothetical protein
MQRQLDAAGAYWGHSPEFVEFPLETGFGDIEEVAIDVMGGRVEVGNGYRLDVSMALVIRPYVVVDYLTYRYHLQGPGQPCVWRYDKHPKPGFEAFYGHVHIGLGENERIEPTELVEFDEIMARAQADAMPVLDLREDLDG